jgi:hypothetical protein
LTAEGENWLLTQQVARFLLKSMQKFQEDPNSLPVSLHFMKSGGKVEKVENYDNVKTKNVFWVQLFDARAAAKVERFVTRMGAGLMAGNKLEQMWNDNLIDMYGVTKAYR